MYKKDYLQRQFESFGKVIAALFGLRKEKNYADYEKEYVAIFLKFTSLSPEKIEKLDLGQFVSELEGMNQYSQDQFKMLADLLYEKLNFYIETAADKQAENLQKKCLYLYEFLQNNHTENEFNLEIHYRLNLLRTLEL